MAVTDRAAQVAPYLEQLLENDDVRDNIRRAAAASRDAYGRTRGKTDKKNAARDRVVQKRVREAAEAGRSALVAIRQGPRKQKRRRRGRVLGIVIVGAGAAALAASPGARAKLLGPFGGSQPEPA